MGSEVSPAGQVSVRGCDGTPTRAARSCRKPRMGAMPEPAAIRMIGVLGSVGRWKFVGLVRTEQLMCWPDVRLARKVDARPRYSCEGLASDGPVMMSYVMLATLLDAADMREAKGEDEIEY